MSTTTTTTVALKGHECIQAARRAYDLFSQSESTELVLTKSKQAAKELTLLQENGKFLKDATKESRKLSIQEEKKLTEKKAELESEKNSYDVNITNLKRQERDAESRCSSLQKSLSESRNKLSSAESRWSDAKRELKRAKEKQVVTTASAVGTGILVGIFTFGIGGAVAGGAIAAGVATLINELEGKVDKAASEMNQSRTDIRQAEEQISTLNGSLSSVRSQIQDYSRRISDNQRKLQQVHAEITRMKSSIDFLKHEAEIWELCTIASEKATERTARLKGIVDRANANKEWKILQTNGTIKIARTFIEAWEEIYQKQGQITQ